MTAETSLPALEVDLPRLGGLRPIAEELLEPHADAFADKTVVLNARRMTVGTVSYADGLVSSLKRYGAAEVLVVGATDAFEQLLVQAGQQHGLPTRVVHAEQELPPTRPIAGLQPA